MYTEKKYQKLITIKLVLKGRSQSGL